MSESQHAIVPGEPPFRQDSDGSFSEGIVDDGLEMTGAFARTTISSDEHLVGSPPVNGIDGGARATEDVVTTATSLERDSMAKIAASARDNDGLVSGRHSGDAKSRRGYDEYFVRFLAQEQISDGENVSWQ